jgi:hypothetical protein
VARHGLRHQRALGAIAVTAAAEHRHQSARAQRAQCSQQLVHGIRCVGVVDDHGGGAVEVCAHALHAARHLRALIDALGQDVEGQGRRDADAARHERVLHVEIADEGKRRAQLSVRQLQVQAGSLQPHFGFQQSHVRFGVGAAADAHDPRPRVQGFRFEEWARGVVDVEYGGAAGREVATEEQRFRSPVRVHVAVEVQMILGEVGEGAHRELAAVHAAQLQAVGRDLHDHRVHARVSHAAQRALKVEALRRRVQ